jgi:hypothetical protein
MNCPACQYEHVKTNQVCKVCGYAFWGPQTNYVACLASIDRSLRSIKNIMMWWVKLSVACGLIWLFLSFVRST